MKALFTTSIGNPKEKRFGTVELRELDIPSIDEEQVLIKVAYASICGSDGHVLRGNLGPLEPGVLASLPRRMGHEISGVIEESGAKALAMGFKPGDRITGNYTRYCQTCDYCHSGKENFCQRPSYTKDAMSQYVAWHMSQIYKIPDEVSLLDACMTEPLTIALGAVETARVSFGKSVLIIGAGGIGLMITQLARLAGAGTVVVTEPDPGKREIALAVGADAAIDGFDEEAIRRAAMDYTNTKGFDCIIESSGASAPAQMAFELIAPDGNIVYLSMYKPEFNLQVNPFVTFYMRQVHVHGLATTADSFVKTLQVLPRVDFSRIIQKVYTLDEYEEAFKDQLSGKYAKIVFQCNP